MLFRLLKSQVLIPHSIDNLSEENYASVGLLTTLTQSIADNTQAASVIDDLVRNSPLFAASFTNGSIKQTTHLVSWLEPFEDSWETKVKG